MGDRGGAGRAEGGEVKPGRLEEIERSFWAGQLNRTHTEELIAEVKRLQAALDAAKRLDELYEKWVRRRDL